METERDLSFDYEILPETHSPMYLMHKYWARKPANIVRHYITKYCPERGIVLDPFMGSGVTILESLLSERFAVGVDINPLALFITKNTGSHIDLTHFKSLFQQISAKIQESNSIYEQLFGVKCPKCHESAFLSHILWENNLKEIIEIRLKCRKCKDIRLESKAEQSNFFQIKNFLLKQEDHSFFIAEQAQIDIPAFQFEYSSDHTFIQLRHNLRKRPDLRELFSKRNLVMLSWIRQLIIQLSDEYPLEKELLLFCLTSSIGQASKMVWAIDQRKGNKLDKPQVGSWTHHFFWDPSKYFEVNAWACFQERYKKIIQGKLDAMKRFESPQAVPFELAEKFNSISSKTPVLLLNTPAQSLNMPDNSIDFIFTDPPYGDSIQYGELNALWGSFLGLDMKNYLESIKANEIVMNSKQQKNLDSYQSMLSLVFKECFRVLKPSSYMIITFHNTSLEIRNALVLATLEAGFRLCQILFQMPPRVSIKSMLHHSGSPVGDNYIRFQKPKINQNSLEKAPSQFSENHPYQFTEKEIYEIIRDFFSYILQKRGEPTSFLWISTFLDEYLFKKGIYPLPKIEYYLNWLKNSEDFAIDDNAKWWFKKTSSPDGIDPPLTNRIENFLENHLTELSLQQGDSQQTIKQNLYNAIYAKFRGILTPDKFDINKLIEIKQKIIENRQKKTK